jgi:hypothetical protein
MGLQERCQRHRSSGREEREQGEGEAAADLLRDELFAGGEAMTVHQSGAADARVVNPTAGDAGGRDAVSPAQRQGATTRTAAARAAARRGW